MGLVSFPCAYSLYISIAYKVEMGLTRGPPWGNVNSDYFGRIRKRADSHLYG